MRILHIMIIPVVVVMVAGLIILANTVFRPCCGPGLIEHTIIPVIPDVLERTPTNEDPMTLPGHVTIEPMHVKNILIGLYAKSDLESDGVSNDIGFEIESCRSNEGIFDELSVEAQPVNVERTIHTGETFGYMVPLTDRGLPTGSVYSCDIRAILYTYQGSRGNGAEKHVLETASFDVTISDSRTSIVREATPQLPLVIGDGRVVFGARNETETRLAVYAPESAESAVLTFGTCKSFDEEFALTDTPIMLGPLEGNASTTFTITLETPSFLRAGEQYSCTASVHDDAGDAIAYGAFQISRLQR